MLSVSGSSESVCIDPVVVVVRYLLLGCFL